MSTITFSTLVTTYRVTVYNPAPITDPARLLPLHRMNWSRDAYGALRAFQYVGDVEADEVCTFSVASFDF